MIYPTMLRANGSGWQLGIGRLGAIVGPLMGALFVGLPVEQLYVWSALPFAAGAVVTFIIYRAEQSAARGASGTGQGAVTGGRRYFDRPDPGLTTRNRASPSNTLLLNLFAVRLGRWLGNAERREANQASCRQQSRFAEDAKPWRGSARLGSQRRSPAPCMLRHYMAARAGRIYQRDRDG